MDHRDHHHGERRHCRPRPSILGSPRYEAMDINGKLLALFRENGTWLRFRLAEKSSQSQILHILAQEGPMTQRALTEKIGIQPGSASEVLGKLEKAGLISRTTSPQDRRTADVTLTEAGRQQEAANALRRREQRAVMFSALTPEEKETLRGILETLSRDWQSRAAARDGLNSEQNGTSS